jgi:hypothetical protein
MPLNAPLRSKCSDSNSHLRLVDIVLLEAFLPGLLSGVRGLRIPQVILSLSHPSEPFGGIWLAPGGGRGSALQRTAFPRPRNPILDRITTAGMNLLHSSHNFL